MAKKLGTILLETGCRHQVKAEDICTRFLRTDIVHISEPRREKEGQQGPEEGQNNGWKRGEMEVRWLLTNRKHGGKTKSVSVLKAALKNGGMGKNRKTIVNDRKRGRDREEISKSLRQKKEH